MNRKIAITIHSIVELLVLLIFSILFYYGVLSVTTLVAVVVSFFIISGTVMIVFMRKLPPAEMKKVNFQLSSTKESTIVEFFLARIFLIILILDIIMISRGSEHGASVKIIVGGVIMMLRGAYCQKDSENADVSKILFLTRCNRILAVCVMLLVLVWGVMDFLGLSYNILAFGIPSYILIFIMLWNFFAIRRLKKNKKSAR